MKYLMMFMLAFLVSCGGKDEEEQNLVIENKDREVEIEETVEERETKISITVNENNFPETNYAFDSVDLNENPPENLELILSCVKTLEGGLEDRIFYTMFKPGIKAFKNQLNGIEIDEGDGYWDGKLCEIYSSKKDPVDQSLFNADVTKGFCLGKIKEIYNINTLYEGYSCAYKYFGEEQQEASNADDE